MGQIAATIDHGHDLNDINQSSVGIRMMFINDQIPPLNENPSCGGDIRSAGTKARIGRQHLYPLADVADQPCGGGNVIGREHQPDFFELALGAR